MASPAQDEFEQSHVILVQSPEIISSVVDIILVVGPQKSQLRVSSHCLIAASPVFEALITSNWKVESLRIDLPKILQLGEDDTSAMRHLCHLIHHSTDQVPDDLDARSTLKLAVVCSKYGCSTNLWYAMGWFVNPDACLKLRTEDHTYYTAASYVLRDSQSFEKNTADMITSTKGPSFSLLETNDFFQHLPGQFFCESMASH